MAQQEIGAVILPGPCAGCGDTNFPLSMGGPSVCPACDCSPPEQRVRRLTAENRELRRLLAEMAGPLSNPGGIIDLDGPGCGVFAVTDEPEPDAGARAPWPPDSGPDHAGSILARALLESPRVSGVDAAGCTELPGGGMAYGLTVTVTGPGVGTVLLVADVQAV